MTSERAARIWQFALPPLTIVAAVVAWEALVRLRGIAPIYLPAPSSVFVYLWRMIADGSMPYHLGITLLRIFDRTHKTILFVTHAIEEAILLGDEVVVMTARPGRIKDVIAVDLPRPRSHEMVAAKEFGALFDRTFHLIREEVTKTMAQQDALEAR